MVSTTVDQGGRGSKGFRKAIWLDTIDVAGMSNVVYEGSTGEQVEL